MNKLRWALSISCSLLLATSFVSASPEPQDTLGLFEFSPKLNHKRLDVVKYSTIGLYPVSMYWLYTQWYQHYPQSSFHSFNDVVEWEHMDKAGHLVTSYGISKGYAGVLEWAGV